MILDWYHYDIMILDQLHIDIYKDFDSIKKIATNIKMTYILLQKCQHLNQMIKFISWQ